MRKILALFVTLSLSSFASTKPVDQAVIKTFTEIKTDTTSSFSRISIKTEVKKAVNFKQIVLFKKLRTHLA